MNENGHLVVTSVNGNLNISIGDILLMFLNHDMREKDLAFYNSKAKNCKNYTLCWALFVTPPFPHEILNIQEKVS